MTIQSTSIALTSLGTVLKPQPQVDCLRVTWWRYYTQGIEVDCSRSTTYVCMQIIAALENKLHQVTICLIIDWHLYISTWCPAHINVTVSMSKLLSNQHNNLMATSFFFTQLARAIKTCQGLILSAHLAFHSHISWFQIWTSTRRNQSPGITFNRGFLGSHDVLKLHLIKVEQKQCGMMIQRAWKWNEIAN